MSYRLRFMFWLDMDNPDDVDVADIIEWLKNERKYTQSIRDGLRLVWELRHGDTDTLYALYPELAPGAVELQRDSEADEQIARGDYETFDNIDDFVNSLVDGDKE